MPTLYAAAATTEPSCVVDAGEADILQNSITPVLHPKGLYTDPTMFTIEYLHEGQAVERGGNCTPNPGPQPPVAGAATPNTHPLVLVCF